MGTRAASAVLALAAVVVALAAAPASAAQATRDAVDELLSAGAIDQAAHDRFDAAYDAAIEAARKLRGTRRSALRGVVADVDGMAERDALDAGTLPAVTLTLERNVQWWPTRPIVAAGARVSFDGDELVWQRYPGHGLQIQWLGTFGKANGLKLKRQYPQLKALLDEAISLAAPRGDGIAWEYLFAFDRGRPPWVSGLAQGTALSALAHGAQALGDPSYLDVARRALSIFGTPPPVGVRVATKAGAHYLQYSFAPKLKILNGFVQSLNGLADLRAQTGPDAAVDALLAAGDAEALAELPSFDTGGWSRYAIPGADSSLHYHRLLEEFVQGRCDRGGDQRFCDFAAELRDDLVTPPTVEVVSRRAHRGRATSLRIRVDKPATVRVKIAGPADYKLIRKATIASGTSTALRWRPRHSGSYAVEVTATDPAGNAAPATGAVAVAG
jgi:hypothetical protein